MAEAPQEVVEREGAFVGSPSVQRVLGEFGADKLVTSWELVRELLGHHGEYGSGAAAKAVKESGPKVGLKQPVPAWEAALLGLFDPSTAPQIHGKLFIWGLALLDRGLRRYLSSIGFLDAITREIREPLDTLLSEAGLKALREGETADPTVFHTDTPQQHDHLGRRGFAEALALWLSRFWQESCTKAGRSFVVHIHGPWGSGKTTLLKLLEQALKPGPKSGRAAVSAPPGDHALEWIVVWFNAWRHQHISPPWWPLLDQIYRESRRQTRSYGSWLQSIWIGITEFVWRLRSGHKRYWLAFGGSAVALAALIFMRVGILDGFGSSGDVQGLPRLAGDAENLATVLALLGTVWSGVLVLNRSLLAGAAQSAESFVGATRDPMQRLRQHFGHLVRRVQRPIMVYIDDLDRCRSSYAVDVLEGLQTLFSDSRVFYVVAADRRWLYVCFETGYEDFAADIKQPGRPLGYLFLEKAFQLSLAVPRLSPELQETYLDFLVTGEESQAETRLDERRREAAEEFRYVFSEEEIYAKLKQSTGDKVYDQIRLEAAVRQTAVEEVEISTEYFLKPFAPLLEPNPRAMKRLVTAYGIHRALVMLRQPALVIDEQSRKQLALWTILTLRWPALEEYLADHPDKIEPIRAKKEDEDIPENLLRLAQREPDVARVLNGDAPDIKANLDQGALETLLGLQTSHDRVAVVA